MSAAILHGLRDSSSDGQATEPRLQVMAIILVISLFSVSFPGVSKAIPFLRIPRVVFFIGKHFGTGVILATAFIHLLQDSFEALQKRLVKEHFRHVGKYTGLIILASLLSIFLIEYLSTSYVDHLHAEPSLPPTPVPSRSPSPQDPRHHAIKSSLSSAPRLVVESAPPVPSTGRIAQHASANAIQLPRSADETTPLLRPPRTQSTPHAAPPPHIHANHHAHHALLPAIATQEAARVIPIEVITNSPRIIKMRGCTCVVGHACACPASALSSHPHTPLSRDSTSRDPSRSKPTFLVHITEHGSDEAEIERGRLRSSKGREEEEESGERLSIGRKRQVIGLLVLQLGIMIHSIVIGLTLAITTGADFTSLTTAVIFHQLFEGLSLGIRIASLPPPPSSEKDDAPPGTTACKTGVTNERNTWKRMLVVIGGERGEGWLKCTLAILFGITTPLGMGIGLIAFQVGKQKEGIELARMYLIQGIMSAISAGMLIYVSTVEMIAGDFVFGDVEGHSHHGHGHTHEFPSLQDEELPRTNPDHTTSRSRNSSSPEPGNEDFDGESIQEDEEASKQDYHHHHHHHHIGKIGKKVLAVLSLLAGVGCMVLVGFGE